MNRSFTPSGHSTVRFGVDRPFPSEHSFSGPDRRAVCVVGDCILKCAKRELLQWGVLLSSPRYGLTPSSQWPFLARVQVRRPSPAASSPASSAQRSRLRRIKQSGSGQVRSGQIRSKSCQDLSLQRHSFSPLRVPDFNTSSVCYISPVTIDVLCILSTCAARTAPPELPSPSSIDYAKIAATGSSWAGIVLPSKPRLCHCFQEHSFLLRRRESENHHFDPIYTSKVGQLEEQSCSTALDST